MEEGWRDWKKDMNQSIENQVGAKNRERVAADSALHVAK